MSDSGSLLFRFMCRGRKVKKVYTNSGTHAGFMPAPVSMLQVSLSKRLQMQSKHVSCSNLPLGTVEGIPDTSYTLIQRLNRLGDLLQLLAAGISQQQSLLEDLTLLEIADTDGLFATVDVVTFDYGVFSRPGRDGDFDLRVLLCESGKGVLKEGAERWVRRLSTLRSRCLGQYVLHTL